MGLLFSSSPPPRCEKARVFPQIYSGSDSQVVCVSSEAKEPEHNSGLNVRK